MMIKNISRADLHLGELHSPGSLLRRSGARRAGERRDEQEVKKSIYSWHLSCHGNLIGFFFFQFARFINKYCLTTLQQVSYAVNVHATLQFSFS